MATVISIINQKGGVGKTTTALALSAGLSARGLKVLSVDMDAQGNFTYVRGVSVRAGSSLLDVLTGAATAAEAIHKSAAGDIIPAAAELSAADMILTGSGKEARLKDALKPVHGNYDYIIIDTPPALGILTINALIASTGMIITAQADIFSLQGISQLKHTVDAVRGHSNHDLKVMGILLCRHSSRTILSRDMTEMLEGIAETLNTKLFKTRIRETVTLKESQAQQQDIFSYAPKSNGAEDYRDFIDELLGGGEHGKEGL